MKFFKHSTRLYVCPDADLFRCGTCFHRLPHEYIRGTLCAAGPTLADTTLSIRPGKVCWKSGKPLTYCAPVYD